MAKKSAAVAEADKVARYEELFDELTRFVKVISDQDKPIVEARAAVENAKAQLDAAKSTLYELENIRDGAKHNLYRFLSPSGGKFTMMPLFDRMEKADEEIHGNNAQEWRGEPIASLGLSLPSLQALADADIVMVGQLQDRVLEYGKTWWEAISGLNAGSAGAIVDRLNDFICDRS